MLKHTGATLLVAGTLLIGCTSNPNAPEMAEQRAAAAPRASASPAAAPAARAWAILRDAAGDELGTAQITEAATGGVLISVNARGLAPGLHGLHLHTTGACEPGTTPTFASAGGHLNPTGRQHGHHNPEGHHRGDLPNLMANEAGIGRLTVRLDGLTFAELFDGDGTALVLHQNEDDLRTDTGPLGPGNSGPRIACGVVQRQ